jgi:serine/threonine-protein kinase
MGGDRDGAEADALVGLSAKDVLTDRERLPKSVASFRIIREIGRGGMGVVYEGIEEHHGQRVAVKVLNDSLTTESDLARRFEREAMILKSLDHPNIVRLVAWGREALRLYIAMEFLDGVTVEEVVRRRGRLPLDLVIAIAEPIARAVEYVHERGFVRNDIKPSNVMITATGRVCLLDFGISRPMKAVGEGSASSGATDKAPGRDGGADGDLDTRSFVIIGTPQLMAPEQFTTGVDERSDIYSLGVVLYRMLTGAYPFEGLSLPDLMRAHVERMPDPPSSRAPVSAPVDALVLRCLAKNPADRFQTMAEVASALAAIGPAQSATALATMVKEVREAAKQIDAIDDMRTIAEGPETAIEVFRRSSGFGARVTPAPPAPLAKAVLGVAAPRWSPFRPSPSQRPVQAAVHAPVQPSPVQPPPVQQPRYEFAGPRPTTRGPVLALVAGGMENVLSTQGAQNTFRLTKRMTFGRYSENDVVLRAPTVSRSHAVFYPDDDEWYVEDANSGCGTFVNGEPLIDRRTLHDGDEIRLGEFVFLFAR